MNTQNVEIGKYRHWKGNLYQVLGVATKAGCEPTIENQSVVYFPLYGEKKGVLSYRPLAMFLDEINRPEQGYRGPRFMFLENLEPFSYPGMRECVDAELIQVLAVAENTENKDDPAVIYTTRGRPFATGEFVSCPLNVFHTLLDDSDAPTPPNYSALREYLKRTHRFVS